jgi:uncharacterized SAM-binding protein YcdF (DUF218 family)
MILVPLLDLINEIPRDLFLPPSSLFLVIGIGLAIWRKWPRAGKIVTGVGLVALTIMSSSAGAEFFVLPLERQTAPLLAPDRAGAQAIVVLAAGEMHDAPEYGGQDIPDYIALARLRYAAHLQRLTKLPILVSGGDGTIGIDPKAADRPFVKADAMAVALQEDFGVPVRWIEPRSRDTAENAAFSAALLKANGIKRILLVTDAMHMPRSHAAFERAGLDVVSAPTMFFSRRAQGPGAWVPSAEGTRRAWYAVYELLGLVWYRVRAGGGEPVAAAVAKVPPVAVQKSLPPVAVRKDTAPGGKPVSVQ